MREENSGKPLDPYLTLFEANIHVARDRVALRLREHLGGKLTLEQRICRIDGPTQILIHAIDDHHALTACASADVHYEHLRAQYRSIQDICLERRQNYTSDSYDCPSCVLNAIGQVRTCTNEGELMELVYGILKRLGIASYVYRWVHTDHNARNIKEQHCLIGCHPLWTRAHARHRWYEKDPFLDHARRCAAPSVGTEVESYRHDLHSQLTYAKCGFNSVLVCAAHSPASSIFGMLQVGNDQPPPEGEGELLAHRLLLRAITEEMLDWRIAILRKEAARLIDLDSRELAVLRLLRNGRTACNVADSLGISQRSVYLIFQKINGKLGVSHIARSLEKVKINGLLE